MDADARAFDAAATALRGAERANAERALLELRARRDARAIARGVLERPRESSTDGQFHAARCFRDATLRDWGAMRAREREECRAFALSLIHI